MARTLSRIATIRFAAWLACAAMTGAKPAGAEPEVQVSRPANVVENPFASRARTPAPADDQSAHEAPKAYRNPFAPQPDAPRTISPVRQPGPLSRWRTPTAGERHEATPTDPIRFSSEGLRHPHWLTPTAEGRATATRDAAGAGRSPQALPTDPFDIRLDTTPATPATPPTVAAPRRPESCYDDAEQLAATAASLDELAEVVRLCQQGLAGRPQGELNRSLRGLAAWAANRRGELQSDAGREDDALREFELAIRFDPDCWLAIHNRGVSFAQQGRAEAALADFNRALTLNPGLAVAYRNRGELLAALGRTDEAIADYARAIDQLPGDASLRLMRGHALHRLGHFQAALDDLNRAIQLDPQNAEAYAHRGNVYAELGKFGPAVADYRQSLALDAESAEAYRSLAWLLATCPDPQFRQPQQALAAAERAARLAPPGDPFVLDALAAAHAGVGQFDQAIRYQREAIAAAPKGFGESFSARLALYERRKPFRNAANGETGVEAASHQGR